MKWTIPVLPAWAWATLAAVAGAAVLAAEFAWPRIAIGPPLEGKAGFYAGAGFAAGAIVLAAAWLARLLREPQEPEAS